ncbi:MAG: apolipoprotein N-acyltransferase [Gemmataceae bacterium]
MSNALKSLLVKLPAQHLVPDSAVSRPARFRPALLAAGLSAVLFYVSFFPANQGWCAWFALVPMLVLIRSPISTRLAALAAFLVGLPVWWITLQWVRVAHPMMYAAWIALGFYCSIYPAFAVWLLRRLDRLPGVPLTLSLPVVWISLEYLRAHFVWGFAWYFLGHSQHDYLPMIQVTDLGGVYAVSFLVAAVNGALFELLCRWARFRSVVRIPSIQKPVAIPAALVVLLLAGALGYGFWRIGQTNFANGPTVALLQSNIDQGTKSARNNDAPPSAETPSQRMLGHMAGLTEAARRQPADLMIWPETTCPYDWIDVAPNAQLPANLDEVVADRRDMAKMIAAYSSTNVLIGLNAEEFTASQRSDRYNSALLIDRAGRPLGRYDKMHCVPFGEYIPMRRTCPWMSVFSPYKNDYSLTPGSHWTRFTLPTSRGDFHFGVIICYEDSDPLLAREYALPDGDQPPVDFLVNISNDGWFDGTEEHEQHLAICRFRAIEARRSVARAVNMGISAVIDGNGKIVALSGPSWHAAKKVATTVTAMVPIDRRASLYARLGDWLPAGCVALGLLGLITGAARRKAPGSPEKK